MTDIILKNVPISAVYVLDNRTGEMHRESVEYADVSADLFARLLLEKFGRDAIFKEAD